MGRHALHLLIPGTFSGGLPFPLPPLMETPRGGDSTAPSSPSPIPRANTRPNPVGGPTLPKHLRVRQGRKLGAAGGKGESKERKPAPGYLGVLLRGKHHLQRCRAAGLTSSCHVTPGLPAQEEAPAHPTARGAALPNAVPHQHARLPCAGTPQQPPPAPPPARQAAFVRAESTSRPSARTAPALQPQEAPLLSLTWIEMLLRLEISVKIALLCVSSLHNPAKGISATPRAARILAFRPGSPEAERSCSRTDAASRAPCTADGWSAHGRLPCRLRAAEEPSLLCTKSCCSAMSTSQHSCC